MWQFILKAPAWLMRMVGVNDSGDPIAESLANKLERHSFYA
jgi:hypothetical protein